MPDATTSLVMSAFFTGPDPVPLSDGSTVHIVSKSGAIGPARSIEGELIIETPDGNMRRVNGRELVAIMARNPWLRDWRLADDGEGFDREDD